MSHPYDRWLQSDADFERFHGLIEPEEDVEEEDEEEEDNGK
jgi:hypothetical protein